MTTLVNAAGVFGPIALVHDGDPRAWLDTIAVDLGGSYLCCRAFLAGMLDEGWGRIVKVGSAAAFHTPGPSNSACGTAKVALDQFTRHLAAGVAGTGVTANVIHPGDANGRFLWNCSSGFRRASPHGSIARRSSSASRRRTS